MARFYTSGQVARRLRISVSTLKRWLEDPSIKISEQRNCNGWRLFSDLDLSALHTFKLELKRNGKRFKEAVLIPVVEKGRQIDSFTAPKDARG